MANDLEDSQPDVDPSKLTIFIDPLDATREYTLGNTECVLTLIGIALNGRPIAGVMHQPFAGDEGRTFYGMVGSGVKGLLADEKQTVDASNRRIVTSFSHFTPEMQAAIDRLKPTEVIRIGGAGFKALKLLKGEAEIYYYPADGCKLWDTCAPHALLLAASGNMTNGQGEEIEYHADSNLVVKGVLASMIDHADLISKIK
eukprot:TRINITY_DN5721_c0_g1_i2.p1 TRINITY_DN5721_c0_g1~~TRINITY_DN5721_c0_g1_i2.p1  ORF type:complete len:200 (+),score=53.23 TRINITY_DN5721_c0_g1_i2:320-919(+)